MNVALDIPMAFSLFFLLGWISFPQHSLKGLQKVRYLLAGMLIGAGGAIGIHALTTPLSRVGIYVSTCTETFLSFPSAAEIQQSGCWRTGASWMASSLLLALITRNGLRLYAAKRWEDRFVSVEHADGGYAGYVTAQQTDDAGESRIAIAVTYRQKGNEWHECRSGTRTATEVEVTSWESENHFRSEHSIVRHAAQTPSVEEVSYEISETGRDSERLMERNRLQSSHVTTDCFLGRCEIGSFRGGQQLRILATVRVRNRTYAVPLVEDWRMPEGGVPDSPAPKSLRGATVLEEIPIRVQTPRERLDAYRKNLRRSLPNQSIIRVNDGHWLLIHLLATAEGRAELKVAWWPEGVRETISSMGE